MLFVYVLLIFFLLVPVINLVIAYFKTIPQYKIITIGHRGAAGLVPENTLLSVDTALTHHADYIEIDVRVTRDGQLVVLHDRTVDRTTNGTGPVDQMTYHELAGLDASKPFPKYRNKTQVPLLTQVLSRIKQSNAKLLIEIKDPKLYPGIVSKLVAIINETDSVDKVAVFSFDKAVVQQIKRALPNVQTGVLCIGLEFPKVTVDFIGPNWISILYFPFIVERIHKRGSKVFVWTPNHVFWMKYLYRMKVDGIITDRPDVLNALFISRTGSEIPRKL